MHGANPIWNPAIGLQTAIATMRLQFIIVHVNPTKSVVVGINLCELARAVFKVFGENLWLSFGS